MPASHAPPSPTLQPTKRARHSSSLDGSPPANVATSPTSELTHDASSTTASQAAKPGHSSSSSSSNFRNVSACNRCRLRKNRCDQRLPSCASCEKAGVDCVGYDPITKREIPRSYVYYLETRVEQLETLLNQNSIPFPAAENLEYCSRGVSDGTAARSPTEPPRSARSDALESPKMSKAQNNGDEGAKLQKLVSKSNMAGVQGASSNPRYLGSTSGVSFARVVFAAVQSSVTDQRSTSEKGGIQPYRPARPIAGNGSVGAGTSMRDSFFGLHTKPTIHPAPFPDRDLGLKLVTLYFEHANPQIPVLHKGDFMDMFEKAYADEDRVRGSRELYMLNMVFAIGGGIIMGDSLRDSQAGSDASSKSKQHQPEEYHASAIVHLETCLGSSEGGLQELQAVLLLANFALLRPVPPGLWYIVGVAVRLAVDLGLHYEDGKDVEEGLGEIASQPKPEYVRRLAERQYTRDLRRRLWWCTYSFDRLVSVCVGRPFGVSDQVVTTAFPSLLEDRFITRSAGLAKIGPELEQPTYKLVAHHYFRLRLLQSEILQVLQYQQAQGAKSSVHTESNEYMLNDLRSPFLDKYGGSFRTWRVDIDRRLYQWKNEIPLKPVTGVAFSTEFLDLNYWQAIIMLYRQSLSVPAMFEKEYNTSAEINSPASYRAELVEDQDRVYVKVAEAGQKILRLYRQLHLVGLVNYTYLATHHLFMAGISYLYAIWHSPVVRSRLSMAEVDFTILAATSVFKDLIEKCPPAEACRDAFERTAKATLKMAHSKGGFGLDTGGRRKPSIGISAPLDVNPRGTSDYFSATESKQSLRRQGRGSANQFDTSAPGSYTGPSSAALSYSMPGVPDIKSEADDYSTIRTAATASNISGTPEATLPIDPSLLPSPTQASSAAGPIGSPMSGMAPLITSGNFLAQPAVFSPGGLSYSELQGMDFLQSLSAASGLGADGAAAGDPQIDLGFGMGWEGMNHDFSDGQQVDLFDGFFFGGQQGGATGG